MHGHDSWETIDDEKVNKQVHLHNEIVREVNTCFDFNFISPKVENDLLKSSKRKSYAKGKKRINCIRYNFNFTLLPDGVHPNSVLAKFWMYRILERLAASDCI